MISYRISISPADWKKMLNILAEGIWIKGATEKTGKHLEEEMKKYPPPRGYPRTGRLRAGWSSRLTSSNSSGAKAVVSNSVSYGPYVQSKDNQAEAHVGYWPTDAEVADAEGPQIGAIFAKEIGSVL